MTPLRALLPLLLPLLLLIAPHAATSRSLRVHPGDSIALTLSAPLPASVTVEAWIRPAVAAQTSLPLFVGRLGAPTDGFGLLVHDGYRFGIGSSASIVIANVAYSATGTSVPLDTARWVHVALVRADTLWYLYRNGMLVGRGTARTSAPSRELHIGHLFNGWLDEVRIWSGARTADEIARMHVAAADGADATGLLARYSMETIATDTLRNDAATGGAWDATMALCRPGSGFVERSAPLASGPAPRVAMTSLPKPMQFFARDEDDSATARVRGQVLAVSCDAIRIEVLRAGAPTRIVELVTGSAVGAAFEYDVRLDAALVQHGIRLSGRVDGEWRQFAEAADLVVGDVFLIAGQSNSHPSDPRSTTTSPFVRSFGVQTTTGNYDPYDPADTLFGIANGHGFDVGFAGPYLAGVWGMRMAERLVEELAVPVFIVNGGAGGSSIEQNARNDADPQSLGTIYGRTLYRLDRSGLRGRVRAILWHQGESNGIYNYYRNFRKLHDDWRRDYPSVERIYVFQIRPGCGGSRHVELRDLQRTLDDSLEIVRTIATVGLPGHDGCHFNHAGYLAMGELAARFLIPDLSTDSIEAERCPEIRRAWYTSPAHREIALLFDTDEPLVWQPDTTIGSEDYSLAKAFTLDDDISGIVDTGYARGDTLFLQLLSSVDATTIGYVPDKNYPGTSVLYEGPWLVDAEGDGAFAFAGIPIREPVASAGAVLAPDASLVVAPSPSGGHIELRLSHARTGRVRLRIVDEVGRARTLLERELSEGSHVVPVDDLAPGVYRCILEASGASAIAPVVIVR